MVGYELKELTDSRAVYLYYPENDRSDCGTVSMNRADGSCEVLEQAENDDFKWYSRHLFSELRDFNSSGHYKPEGCIAWY